MLLIKVQQRSQISQPKKFDNKHFWLGDAFASGGSNGYDHKAMGITAKGGWESVKRHREMGINCQTTDFTAIGVGDMAGDVFGVNTLLSKHIPPYASCILTTCISSIDLNPESASSWVERERLFNLTLPAGKTR